MNLKWLVLVLGSLAFLGACKAPDYGRMDPINRSPEYYSEMTDSNTVADLSYSTFYKDENLRSLIDTAIKNNQELNIFLMELQMLNNETMARKGEYLPSLGATVGGGGDKVGRYTTHGAMEEAIELEPGKEFPEFVPDVNLALVANWEVDIWGKLRNARKAALNRYLGSVEGRNFLVTNLVAEIAENYYELQSLDRQLEIVDGYVELQQNALKVVKLQKESAKATELAVRKFEAEVLLTKSMRFAIKQQIVEAENRINFLVGRFPQEVKRNALVVNREPMEVLQTGVPGQLLENRPDIREASYELEASKLDVKSAKAAFYPSLGISGGIGLNALNPTYLIRPESMALNLAGDLAAPLLNRKAIKANYYNANATQVKAVYNYERSLLQAYIEVVNELNAIQNLQSEYDLRFEQVEKLTDATRIAGDLFTSARADYMEVLMTQRDALEYRFELIETKKDQLNARVQLYRALGGGWK